jgi:hypothetical protein
VPTLPAAATRLPDASRIEASMRTVVVLPLVPVMANHGAGSVRGRSRQASSTSPHTGTPAARAAANSGLVGRSPGEGTSTSTPGGSVSSSPRCTVTPSARSSSARRVALSSQAPSMATTRAPRPCSARTADAPVTPVPATQKDNSAHGAP